MFPACKKRLTDFTRDAAGVIDAIIRCNHPSCERFAMTVTEEYCNGCPLRIDTSLRPESHSERPVRSRDFEQPTVMPDGSIVYTRTGWEPPSTPEGYRRKSDDLSSDEAWAFIPLLTSCLDRKSVNTVRPCGCLSIVTMCESKDAPKAGSVVRLSDCRECPFSRRS